MMSEPETLLSPTEREEFRRTFWSVYLLDKLVSCGRDRPMVLRDDDCSIQLPCSELSFRAGMSEQTTTLQRLSKISDEAHERLDYFALMIWLASCVGHTSRQMLQNRGDENIPPWNSESEFMKSLSRLFESETMVGYPGLTLSHAVQKDFTTRDGIDQQRIGPLIFSQMLFHLCHSLLSHPFLLRERLKAFRRPAPSSFLREAFMRCHEHTDCILQLAADARVAGCNIETSFYGYCVCIAGGIQVLYLNDNSAEVRKKSHGQLQYTLDFLSGLANKWKNIRSMVRSNTSAMDTPYLVADYYQVTALKLAAETAAAIPRALTDPTCTDSFAATSSLDAALWWHVVDYGSLSDYRSGAKTGPLQDHQSQCATGPDSPAVSVPTDSMPSQEVSQSMVTSAIVPHADTLYTSTWELSSSDLVTPLADQYEIGTLFSQSGASTRDDRDTLQTVNVLGDDWFWPQLT
jgi:hypothetical protein